MKSITATWFVCKIRYEKTMEDGLQKRVTEQFVIDAISFSEAEERIIEKMSDYIGNDFEVKDITQAPYGEVFLSEEEYSELWFKAKVYLVTIDKKTGREKRYAYNYLVNAKTMKGAVSNIEKIFDGSIFDYVISSIVETPVVDVFKYKPKEE